MQPTESEELLGCRVLASGKDLLKRLVYERTNLISVAGIHEMLSRQSPVSPGEGASELKMQPLYLGFAQVGLSTTDEEIAHEWMETIVPTGACPPTKKAKGL